MVVSWAPTTTSFTRSPVTSRPARPADEASTATRRGRDRRDRMFGGLLKKKGYRLRRVIGRRRADLNGPACPVGLETPGFDRSCAAVPVPVVLGGRSPRV